MNEAKSIEGINVRIVSAYNQMRREKAERRPSLLCDCGSSQYERGERVACAALIGLPHVEGLSAPAYLHSLRCSAMGPWALNGKDSSPEACCRAVSSVKSARDCPESCALMDLAVRLSFRLRGSISRAKDNELELPSCASSSWGVSESSPSPPALVV